MALSRSNGRSADALRDVVIRPHFSAYAEGSCLICIGNTHVICTASVDEKVPPFLRGANKDWVTAEYGMLPRATHSRMDEKLRAASNPGAHRKSGV